MATDSSGRMNRQARQERQGCHSDRSEAERRNLSATGRYNCQLVHSVRGLTLRGFGCTMPCGKMLRFAVRLQPAYAVEQAARQPESNARVEACRLRR